MTKTQRRALTASVIAAAAFTVVFAWLFRPASSYDRARVHPKLAALAEPLTDISFSLLQDGGSLRIVLTDANGVALRCFIPAHVGAPDRYKRLLLGAPGQKLEEYEEVKNPGHSFLKLQELLHTHRGVAPFSAYIALSTIRGRVRDYLGVLWHRGRD